MKPPTEDHPPMPSWTKTCMFLLTAVFIAACQSSPVVKLYDGGERPAAQVAVVRVPETLDIVSINGRSPSGMNNSLVGGERELHLSPGDYQIIAFYREIWEPDSTSSHEVLRSEPAIFTVAGRAGGRYVLEYDRPRNADEARELAADFQGWSRDITSGERTATAPSGMARPGLLSNVNIGSATPVAASSAVLPTPINPPATGVPTHTGNTDDSAYLDMLKAYWSQASVEERRTFLRWIAE